MWFAVAFAPDAVIPFVLPQHCIHAQYAVTLYTPLLPDVPVTLEKELLDTITDLLCTCTILSTEFFIISSDNFSLESSSSSLYVTL